MGYTVTDVTEPDSGLRAAAGLLVAAAVSTVKQALDVVVGTMILGLFASGLARLAGVSLPPLLSGYVIQYALYFGSLSLFVWALLVGAVILPEELVEYVDREEMKRDLTGVRGEAALWAADYFSATYKASLVLGAGLGSVIAVQHGPPWLAALITIGLPVIELGCQIRFQVTPLQLLTMASVAAISPLVFGAAVITYAIKRVPDARERASETVSVWLSTGSQGSPGPGSLLDTLVRELGVRR